MADHYIYNVKHQEPVKECPLGLTGFISFRRLEDLMHVTGEIKENESIRAFSIDDHGIKYVVDTEPRR